MKQDAANMLKLAMNGWVSLRKIREGIVSIASI